MRTLTTERDLIDAAVAAVRDRRVALGWRQADLAEKSGVSNSTVRRFETRGIITFLGFAKLAVSVGVVDELVQVFKRRPEIVPSVREFIASGRKPQRVRVRKN